MGSTTTCSTLSIDSSSCNSDEDLHQKINQKRKKRMLSNRQSARRSRLRKHKHLDDLMIQINILSSENDHILKRMHLASIQYVNVEVENSELRAQMVELNSRLRRLTEMLSYMQELNGLIVDPTSEYKDPILNTEPILRPCNFSHASCSIPTDIIANIFQY